MACESPRERLRVEVTCPVCLEYFADPVILACEHSFCRACILQSWAKSPTSTLCPLCKTAFCVENLKPNCSLANFVEITQLLNDHEERAICKRHQQPLKLFCKNDKVLICILGDKKHQGHSVIPVEEALRECKDRISASLETLKKQAEEVMATTSAVHKESQDLLVQMEREKRKTVARFRKLQPFLKKQEGRTLAWMKQTRREMVRKRDKHMHRLDDQLSSLEGFIQEMEAERDLPAGQLLQDVDRFLQSTEQVKLKKPASCLPVLKKKVSAFADSTAALEKAMKEFEDSVTSCF